MSKEIYLQAHVFSITPYIFINLGANRLSNTQNIIFVLEATTTTELSELSKYNKFTKNNPPPGQTSSRKMQDHHLMQFGGIVQARRTKDNALASESDWNLRANLRGWHSHV